MKQRLLIADSDAELCDLYGRFLTERGYEVETSSNGLDCLASLRQVMPEVLVLDLELLWGGGDGVLALLQQVSPTHGIAVILTATAGYPKNFAEFIEPTIMDSLLKPFTLTALLEKVRSAVAKNERRDASSQNRVQADSALFIE